MTTSDFDPLDTEENSISRAVVVLEEGKHGNAQSPSVVQQLAKLETAGLAEYSPKKGWRLTPRGKERARAFLTAARKLRRAEKGSVT